MRIGIALGKELDEDGTLSRVGKERVELARRLLEDNVIDKLILSGGGKRNISEAKAMYNALDGNTAAYKDKVYLEEKSKNTKENVLYSYNLIERENIEPSEVIVCTTPEHMFRDCDNPIVLFKEQFDKNNKEVRLIPFTKAGEEAGFSKEPNKNLIESFKKFWHGKDTIINDIIDNKQITELQQLALQFRLRYKPAESKKNIAELLSELEIYISDNLLGDEICDERVLELFNIFTKNSCLTFDIVHLCDVLIYIALTHQRRKSKSLSDFYMNCKRLFDSDFLKAGRPLLRSFKLFSYLIADEKNILERNSEKQICRFLDIIYKSYNHEKYATSGILSTYADLIATAIDEQATGDNRTEFVNCLNIAEDAIQKAIDISNKLAKNYPKYYAIAAKIYLLKYEQDKQEKYYDNAVENINIAIFRQSQKDTVKTSEFKSLRTKIDLVKLEHKIEKQEKQIEETKRNNLRLMSLFLSIGSFLIGIITKVNNSGDMPFNEVAGIFILMLGIVVSIYSILELFIIDNILPGKKERRFWNIFGKIILVLAGIAFIACGLILGNLAK